MILSIVSGTYNRFDALQNMIQSVRDQISCGIDLEFVIVDGGSTDGTLPWLKKQDDVVLIEHGELLGAIKAFCDGAKIAKGKHVILANDDVTFEPGAILRALAHLEDTPECGAVAFADNRPAHGKSDFAVAYMPAENGTRSIYYAQVGMFRKWIGDKAGWWGADNANFPAKTYAGDNYLSARIWEFGYSVDPVEGANVRDLVIQDDLRLRNGGNPDALGNQPHADTEAFYRVYPGGAKIGKTIRFEQEDVTQLRVLYLPIYEPGHEIQKTQKHGLRDALMRRNTWVQELDYLAIPEHQRVSTIVDWVETFQPHLLISQIHGHNILSGDDARMIRSFVPNMVWINWNGDVYQDALTNTMMLGILRELDMQLVVNGSVLGFYEQYHITSAYWQIGYEEGDPKKARKEIVKKNDIVFLGNAYDRRRRDLFDFVQSTGYSNAFYGSGWEISAGDTTYDFDTGVAILNKAKIVLGDNLYPDQYGFVSNRIFQSLAAGGAMLMHQEIPGLEELTGLQDGVHYVAWRDFEDLLHKLHYYLENEGERKNIARAGTRYCKKHHSFDARVDELFSDLLPRAKRQPRMVAAIQYIGKIRTPDHKPSFSMKIGDTVYQVDLRKSYIVHIDPTHLPSALLDSENWRQVETDESLSLME